MTNPNPFTAFASFDPTGYFAASQQQMAKLATDAQGRAQSFADQYAQLVERTQQAVVTMAQLTQDAIAYGAQLAAEAGKRTFSKWSEAMATVPMATPTASAPTPTAKA